MHLDLTSLHVTLEASRPLTIANGAGTQIQILEGRVWLTEEGVPEDVFLSPGAEYILHRNGRAVLECDNQSHVVLTAAVSVRTRTWFANLTDAVQERIGRLRRHTRWASNFSNSIPECTNPQ